MNPDLWNAIGGIGQGVEAIVVTITAFALLYQVNRWRQESGSHIAKAMDWLVYFLSRDEYKNRVNSLVQSELSVYGGPARALKSLYTVLSDYDQMNFLIESGFFEDELLFRYNSPRMMKIINRIEELSMVPTIRDELSRILNYWKSAYQLLKSGHEWENNRLEQIEKSQIQ